MTPAPKLPVIFLGPLEISGYYGNLERGFTSAGVRSRLVTLQPHPFGFEQAQKNPWPARMAQRLVYAHRILPAPLKLFTGIGYVIASVFLLLWSLPVYNTYIFSWGMSLLPGNLDLPLLRVLGKKVIVVLGHGSEARPPYMSTPETGGVPLDPTALAELRARTASVAAKVRRIERWSTNVIGLPTTGQFFTRPFIDFYSLGLPTVVEDLDEDSHPSDVVVLHIPSKPLVKGSAAIRAAMARIVENYPDVRYLELSGKPHHDILAALRTCTFVVDQLWSDIPMAIVGTEAATLGKATVIAGYAWDTWNATLAPADRPPTFTSEPDELYETIESCIQDLEGTRQLGRAAREFIREKWSPLLVAQNYLRVMDGDIPARWLLDPAQVLYGYGCGVSRENVEEMVRQMVEQYGPGSLRWSGAALAYRLEDVTG